MKYNEFNVAEIFSNSSNGKTSMGKVTGLYLIIIGSVTFVYGVFFITDPMNLNTVLLQSLAVMGMGTGLVASKIFKSTKPGTKVVSSQKEVSSTEIISTESNEH